MADSAAPTVPTVVESKAKAEAADTPPSAAQPAVRKPCPYKFALVRRGNNIRPVRRALDRRPHWVPLAPEVACDEASSRPAAGAEGKAGPAADSAGAGGGGAGGGKAPASSKATSTATTSTMAKRGGEVVRTGPAGAGSGSGYSGGTTVWPANLVWKFLVHPIPQPPAGNWLRRHRNPARRQTTNRLWELVAPLTAKNRLLRVMKGHYDEAGEHPWRAVPLTLILTTRIGSPPEEWEGWSQFLDAFAEAEGDAPVDRPPAPAATAAAAADGGSKVVESKTSATADVSEAAASGEGATSGASGDSSGAKEEEAPLGQNLWLVKPTSSNRGRGIEICDSVEEVRKAIAPPRRRPAMASSDTREWVVQKYIKNPMLWHGRKFDMRVWVLWTDTGPGRGQVRMYTQGYVRTSSDVFSLSQRGKWVHLTNYCLQKHSDSFGTHEAGNTVSFAQLDEYLAAGGGTGGAVATGSGTGVAPPADSGRWSAPMQTIIDQIERVIIDTGKASEWFQRQPKPAKPQRKSLKERMSAHQLKASQREAAKRGGEAKAGEAKAGVAAEGVGPSKLLARASSRPIMRPLRQRQHGFELLGYDFMVDTDLGVWFLEANTNPAVMYQNKWHEELVDSMIEDVFQVAIDPIFPAPAGYPPNPKVAKAPGDPHFKLLHSFESSSALAASGGSVATGGDA